MKRDLAQRFLFFDLYKRISENRSLENCLMTKKSCERYIHKIYNIARIYLRVYNIQIVSYRTENIAMIISEYTKNNVK